MKTVEEQVVTYDSNISWAAYHASQQPNDCHTPAITANAASFSSKSVAMIRHSMDVIKQAVQELNPSQVPVITLDQPLYAIAKSIGKQSMEKTLSFLEDCILWGHIEMAGLKVIGDWLEDCGWWRLLFRLRLHLQELQTHL